MKTMVLKSGSLILNNKPMNWEAGPWHSMAKIKS